MTTRDPLGQDTSLCMTTRDPLGQDTSLCVIPWGPLGQYTSLCMTTRDPMGQDTSLCMTTRGPLGQNTSLCMTTRGSPGPGLCMTILARGSWSEDPGNHVFNDCCLQYIIFTLRHVTYNISISLRFLSDVSVMQLIWLLSNCLKMLITLSMLK